MKVIKYIPLLAYMLVACNAIAIYGGAETEKILSSTILEFKLISGAMFKLDVNGLLIVIGLNMLYIEILKSIRTTMQTVIKHVLSTFVFMLFVIEFIVVKNLGTSTFIILSLMALLDLIQGFTVTISSARRDVVVETN